VHVAADRPTLSGGPGEWDRYYQVGADLDPVLGTPGVPELAFGETMTAGDGSLVQAAHRGFFLVAEAPLHEDPVALSAAIAGTPESGAFASVAGPRRRRARQTATGAHVEVEQLVRGARVIGSEVRLHEDDAGIFAVTGRPVGDIAGRDPGPAPTFDLHEAIDTCAERFEIEEGLRSVRAEQVVFPEGEGATWAYEVAFVVPEHSADVRVYLRADDLSVLLAYNISSVATGEAAVFPVNPLQTADLVDVSLEGLDEPGNLLRGAAIDVSQASGARLDRPGGAFQVDPADPEFDEVQAYHHLWRIREYFSGIVDPGLLQARPFTPIIALVNDPQSPNNAFYMPTTGELRFGAFGSRSSARSASIVSHEFGHAVTDAIAELGRAKVRDTESRGLSEGYSDYFAASMLDDPRLGDYVANVPEGARNCSDPGLRFSADFSGEEHDTGAVWAAVLWAIRGRIGMEAADTLAVESVEFLDSSSSFDDARAALKSVDGKLFDGANEAAIDEEYDGRGQQ
jgi:Fungalysin metallopeptidase (M36)